MDLFDPFSKFDFDVTFGCQQWFDKRHKLTNSITEASFRSLQFLNYLMEFHGRFHLVFSTAASADSATSQSNLILLQF